ncbi:hypothetical protein BDQ17DRAFT_285981 [Cyathus striatus]|nr:hypothetical protein BDQ17DRAFT_285981 [Cyathus striatus]
MASGRLESLREPFKFTGVSGMLLLNNIISNSRRWLDTISDSFMFCVHLCLFSLHFNSSLFRPFLYFYFCSLLILILPFPVSFLPLLHAR